MIDPMTGMPLPPSMPQANSFAGAFAMNTANSYGVSPQEAPAMFGVVAAMPGVLPITAWNARRATNTIMKGGKNARQYRYQRGLVSRNANSFSASGGRYIPGHLRISAANPKSFRQTFNPRYFNRFNSINNVAGTDGAYTPFNFLSKFGNKIGNRMGYSNDLFDPGAYGRLSSYSKINSMSGRSFIHRGGSILNNISTIDPGIMQHMPVGVAKGQRFVAESALLTLRGSTSQRIAGFAAGSVNVTAGRQALSIGVRETATGMGRTGFIAAADLAANKYAAGGAAKMGVRAAAMGVKALPYVNAIGTALMVRDLMIMGGRAMVGVVNTAKDAATSIQGQIAKPVMGMGYVDNTVAATSRARGVMAIANSRLNARSILGNEAASMHAHFG